MDRLTSSAFTAGMTTSEGRRIAHPANPRHEQVVNAVARRSFCTLATASAQDRPHVAGVLYAADGNVLYVSTLRSSRKARNIAGNPSVFVCIPIRRLPVGPPSTVQFSATAEILAAADADIVGLAQAGRLKPITGHGELELPDGCFLRITPGPKLHTYGLGLPLRRLLRDPLHAGASVWDPSEPRRSA